MSETPRSHEERISNLETELAELRRHSHEMDKLIVRLSAVVAVQAGIPQERIDQVLKEENEKIISKLHGNN
jgi:hypothetical protein